jgi:hypothetical protein
MRPTARGKKVLSPNNAIILTRFPKNARGETSFLGVFLKISQIFLKNDKRREKVEICFKNSASPRLPPKKATAPDFQTKTEGRERKRRR